MKSTTVGDRYASIPEAIDRRARRATQLLLMAPIAFVLANLVFLLCHRLIPFGTMVHIAYDTNTLAIPVLMLLSGSVAFRLASPSSKKPRRYSLTWIVLALLLVAVRIYATHIEPHNLKIRHVTLMTEKIDRPFTLLHITDIQSAAIGSYEEKVFAKIRELNPDLIVHTGDLLQPVAPATYQTELPKLAALFQTLNPPLGMYMVEGDTTGPLLPYGPEKMGGIAYLRNEEALIHAEGINLRLYGLTVRSSSEKTRAREGIQRWLNIDQAALNIVMGHRPDYILKVNDFPIDLCLAGHTHGGQIRIPFFGPLVIFSTIPRDWARGYRTVGNTGLNVSAGIGAEHHRGLPSIRLNCPPEMTLIHFLPKS